MDPTKNKKIQFSQITLFNYYTVNRQKGIILNKKNYIVNRKNTKNIILTKYLHFTYCESAREVENLCIFNQKINVDRGQNLCVKVLIYNASISTEGTFNNER